MVALLDRLESLSRYFLVASLRSATTDDVKACLLVLRCLSACDLLALTVVLVATVADCKVPKSTTPECIHKIWS